MGYLSLPLRSMMVATEDQKVVWWASSCSFLARRRWRSCEWGWRWLDGWMRERFFWEGKVEGWEGGTKQNIHLPPSCASC